MPLGVPTNITQTGNGQNLYLLETDAGGGGGAGVVQLVAGTGVTLSPPSGEGIVTINATAPPAPVTKLVAGANITLNPANGLGEVTISASGGGGGGVTAIATSGDGITANPATGTVVLANTGVTSIVAGNNVSVSGATGAVTVSVATSTNNPFLPITSLGGSNCSPLEVNAPFAVLPASPTEYPGCIRLGIPGNQTATFSGASYNNSGWFAIPYVAGTSSVFSPSYFAVNTGSAGGATGIFNIVSYSQLQTIRGVQAWTYFINGEQASAPGGFPATLSCLKFQNTNTT